MSDAAPALVLALVLATATDAAPVLSPDAILRAADGPRQAVEEGVIRIRATVEEKGNEPAVSNLDVFILGDDHVLCAFRDGTMSGRKVLIVGNRVWLLVPGAKRPIPLSPNQRLLGGAAIADVARLQFATEFDAALRPGKEEAGGVPCDVLDLKAKEPTAAYSGGTLWVGAADGLARMARLALPSGKVAKEIAFVSYGQEEGRTVLRRMEIRHLLRSERDILTTLEFVRYERKRLDAAMFDPARARDLP